MKKLKWWQWSLIAIGGLTVVGMFSDPTEKQVAANEDIKTPTNKYTKAEPKFEQIGGPGFYSMVFNAKVDPQRLPDIAREQCGQNKICKIIGWTDPKFAARALPMTDREVSAQSFQYTLNRNTGFEQTLWDCKIWQQSNPDTCLSIE